ncbi:DsbA family oxidoreductase [Gordonia oryzae]|uniref:DsbA family oxidoreductase n=1 Tax=Gordonia oryzae TaxID=2487349 RepID=UPI003CCC8306
MSSTIPVDVWSDIACPWCYIGKRKFEAGLSESGLADRVTVTYHSFELAPDTPVDFDGTEVDFLVGHKGIARDHVAQMLAHVTAIAADEGLTYDFDALQHTNTVKAHELLHFAKAHGRQLDMVERLFRAYFTEGRHVGRATDLADLAGEIGLARDDALQALTDGTFAGSVAADIAQARAYGISGVPFFVIDGRYGLSGAQAPETFADALRTVAREHADA